MSTQDLPDIGECVIATFRCGGPLIHHGFLSREECDESIVWCQNYSSPYWNTVPKQWRAVDPEYVGNYEVIAWVRLPEPPEMIETTKVDA